MTQPSTTGRSPVQPAHQRPARFCSRTLTRCHIICAHSRCCSKQKTASALTPFIPVSSRVFAGFAWSLARGRMCCCGARQVVQTRVQSGRSSLQLSIGEQIKAAAVIRGPEPRMKFPLNKHGASGGILSVACLLRSAMCVAPGLDGAPISGSGSKPLQESGAIARAADSAYSTHCNDNVAENEHLMRLPRSPESGS